jgi:hypothetical protein
MAKYETTAGQVTRADTYSQLIEHLIRCQELSATMAHLHNTEGNDMDKLLARGWLGVAEMFRMTQHKITMFATKGMFQ